MIAKGTRKVVPVRDIKISEAHWNRTITDEGIDALADNFEVIGQLNPITVRPVGKAGRVFELLAGRRRLEAMKKTGHKEIEVKVVRCTDEEARIMSLSENLQTEKPNSREWSDAFKELADLTEERLTREQKARRDRSAKNTTGPKAQQKQGSPELSAPGAQKSRGRPTTPKAQAVKQAAKTTGVSERTAQLAYKRSADLISSAKKAWEDGKISTKQADSLASMSKSDQRRQLSKMVSETQRATTDRRRSEIQQQAKGPEAERVTIRTLRELVEQAKKWKVDASMFMQYVDGRALNWDNIFQGAAVTSEDLLPCMEQMSELFEFLAAD